MRDSLFCRVVLVTALIALSVSSVVAQPGDSQLLSGAVAPDVATFLQVGYAVPTGYSWNGNDVYFRSSLSGVPQVYRLTAEGWPYQLTTFDDGVDFFLLSWGGNMAIVGASTGGSEQSQLYLMDTRTGILRQLTDNPDARYRSVIWAKDDRSIIYNSTEENGTDYHLYRKYLDTGRTIKVAGDSSLPGAKYPISLSQDGRQLIFDVTHSNTDIDLYLLDLQTLQYRQLNQDTTDVNYEYARLMPDNRTIYMICNSNPDGIRRLAKMHVDTGDIEFIDDGWVDPKWGIDKLTFSRDYRYMAVTINEDGYVRLKIRERESKLELPSPPLDGLTENCYFDQYGRTVFSFQSATRSPDVWRWDPSEEKLTQLTFSSYAGIDRETLNEPELVHFRSFDSLEIPAFLLLPKDYVKGTPIPFIVYAHGGPTSQAQPKWTGTFQYLTSNGYGVFAVNPRGSTGYGLKYMSLDDYHLRKNSLKDYKAGTDWLIENGYTAPGMIGIRGGSYGGYVVLGMITEYPDLYSAAMDVVGIANYETFLKNTKAYRRANREAEYGPLSDPEFLAEISPIHSADRIKTPLYVVHGENDPRVPVGEARQIIEAVKSNGGVVDSLFFPDEGHGASKLVNKVAMYRKMVEFFDANLKKSPTADAAATPPKEE